MQWASQGSSGLSAGPSTVLVRRFGSVLLAALLHSLAFEPVGAWPLVGIALVPLFVGVQGCRPSEAFALGFHFGVAQAAFCAPWLFGIFGPPALLLLCVHGAWHGAAMACITLALRSRVPLAGAAPPIWVAFGFLRAENPWLPFGWFSPGSALVGDPLLLQTASWWGEAGLSALVVAGNSALATAWIARRLGRGMFLVLAIGGALHGVGALMLASEPAPLRVAIVEGEAEPIEHYEAAIARALAEHPDTKLVVLPEYATTQRISAGSSFLLRLAKLARAHRVTLVFGGTRALEEHGFANTLFFLAETGHLVHQQSKSVPVPLFADGIAARTRAPHAGLGAGICYDMDFPFVARELVANGARLLAFPTMDARHWGTLQHLQHAALAPLRAVENRRWLVRCASSGVSLVTDPWGRSTTGSGTFTACVAERDEVTVFARFGHWLPQLCVGIALVMVVARNRRRQERS